MSLVKETNFYRYSISEFTVLLPGNETKALKHSDIISISIEKDYDNAYFPILNIKLMLDYKTYYNIIENKSSVKFKFKFSKYIVDRNNINDTDITNKFVETYFDTTFGIFIDDDISALDKNLYEKTVSTVGEQPLSKQIYDFYLFKDNDIASGKKSINNILKKCDMGTALMYLFTNANMNKLLMTPLDNSKKYDEIIIPYLPLTKAVSFLEEHYGLYKSGSTLFFDFDISYFIAKHGKNVFRTNEFSTVILTFFKPGDTNSKTPGCYKDKETKKLIIHVSQDNLAPITESIVNEQTSGTNLAIIDTSSDVITDVTPDVQTRAGSTTTVIVNNYENPYITSMLLFNKLENNKIIDVMLTDIDLSFLNPNKNFIFTFDDKSSEKLYGGSYRLTNYIAAFTKQGTNFSIAVNARFKYVGFKQTL